MIGVGFWGTSKPSLVMTIGVRQASNSFRSTPMMCWLCGSRRAKAGVSAAGAKP